MENLLTNGSGTRDQQLAIIILCIVTVLLAVLLHKILSKPKGHAAMLVGPCDAGKTALFLRLCNLQTGAIPTVASMDINEVALHAKAQTCATCMFMQASTLPTTTVIDVPGHPRIRNKIEALLPRARRVIFVIDSVDFMPKKSEAAEQLYDILSHRSVLQFRTPILIACNKADAGPKAHTVDFIRKRLEKEIDQMKSTHSTLAGDEKRYDPIASLGDHFSFDCYTKSTGVPVTSAAVSAVDIGGVEDIWQFLA